MTIGPTVYIHENASREDADIVEQRVIDGKEVLQIKDLVYRMNSILGSYKCVPHRTEAG